MAKFSFWANGILAVAAFLFLLGYLANTNQQGTGSQYINIGILCLALWVLMRILPRVKF